METATYIDENGEKKTGVLQKYQNAADYYSQADSRAKELYESQLAANKAAMEAAAQQRETELKQQLDAQKIGYDNLNKQLYRDYRQSVQNLPEQLAAYGITGGLAESSRVALDTSYGESLNANELQRLAEAASLRAAAQRAGFESQATTDAANQTAYQAYLSQLQQNAAGQFDYEDQLRRSSADTLASIGDYSGYVAMGLLDETQAAAMKAAWIASNPALAARLGYVSQGYVSQGGLSGPDVLTEKQRALMERILAKEQANINGTGNVDMDKYIDTLYRNARETRNQVINEKDIDAALAAIRQM